MALLRTIDATVEPVSTAEAKAHLRVTSSTDDTLIGRLVTAARQMAENEMRRAILPQTWELTLDTFPDAIKLAYPPLISVATVKYLEPVAGVPTTLNALSYTVDNKSEPGWIVPAYGYAWPDIYDAINAVTVTYTAGWATAADVPAAIKSWVLLHVGNLYENREATMPGISITPLPFASALLDPYRIVTF
jgi:uncharacterized phiE125 gp8 family phage protein